jgi:hypothetical protein
MPVALTMSAYPWDLARVGVDAVVGETEAAGMGAIELAANYHTMDVVSPRAGVRAYSSPRGAVLFPARPSRYGRIQPHPGAPEEAGAWTELATTARERGLTVTAAVVALFQPWIVDAHPDCARVLPTGDAHGQSVCPANPDVREYLAALSSDLVDQFGVDSLRFQGPMPATFDFDWLRARSLVTFSSVARELLGICFCQACERRGTDAGIDVVPLRSYVRDTIDRELDQPRTTSFDDLIAHDELGAYARLYASAAVELLGAVRDSILPTGTRISSTAWTPFPRLLAAADDDVLGALVTTVDQVSLTPGWSTERNRRIKPLAAARGETVDTGMVIMRLSPGDDGDASSKELREAAALEVDEITIFSWGSLRAGDVTEIADAVRAEFG